MMIGDLNRLRSAISSLSLFLEINITQGEVSVMLFAFVILKFGSLPKIINKLRGIPVLKSYANLHLHRLDNL